MPNNSTPKLGLEIYSHPFERNKELNWAAGDNWQKLDDAVGAPNGVCPLDSAAKVPAGLCPAAPVTSVAGKIGAVSLNENDIANLTTDLAAKEVIANRGASNGYAPLDATGKVPAANLPATGLTPPPTETLFVDMARTDTYAADGSALKPFKTIMAAVNKVAANGDNATKRYLIGIAPGTYPETLDLSNAALTNLQFFGYAAIIGGASFGGTLLRAINNDNLTDANFMGLTFTSGSGAAHAFQFSSTTNNTNLGSGVQGYGIQFLDCILRPGGTSDFYVSNCGNVTWDRCYITSIVNVTNCILALIKGGSFNQGSQFNVATVAGAVPNGFSGASQIQCQNATCLATISIDALSSFIAAMGSRIRGNCTVNGAFTSRASHTSGNITVNSGGTYKEDGGAGHTGGLTLNGTGVYAQTGFYGIGSLFLNGTKWSNGTGSPNGAVVGNPSDVYVNKSGGAGTTLWVKESGINTNTGWVGK